MRKWVILIGCCIILNVHGVVYEKKGMQIEYSENWRLFTMPNAQADIYLKCIGTDCAQNFVPSYIAIREEAVPPQLLAYFKRKSLNNRQISYEIGNFLNQEFLSYPYLQNTRSSFKPFTINDKNGYLFTQEANGPAPTHLPLKIKIAIVYKNEKVYILSFTALTSSFDQDWGLALPIFNTFKISADT